MKEPAREGSAPPGADGQAAAIERKRDSPFRDDLCVAVLAIPGYSLTECAILLEVAKHAWWGKKTCAMAPEAIADELNGKITVRTVQRSFLKFESNGLIECVKKIRGVGATRETALTEEFWTLVSAELARINPSRYGSGDPIDKRHWCRLGRQSQTTPEALQTTFGAFQTTPEALQTTPVSFAYKEDSSSSMSSSSSSPPGEIHDDDDDVRFAQGEEEKTPETDRTLADDLGACKVGLVVSKCTHLAKLGFAITGRLGRRHGHDWEGVAMAVVYLDEKIERKEVSAKTIETPPNYLLGVLKDIRSPAFAPAELERLRRKMERLQKSEAQLILELLENEYGVSVAPIEGGGYEPIDRNRWPDGTLPINFIKNVLLPEVRSMVRKHAAQMIRIRLAGEAPR